MIIFKTIKIDDELSPHSKLEILLTCEIFFGGIFPPTSTMKNLSTASSRFTSMAWHAWKGTLTLGKYRDGFSHLSFFCGLPPAWKIGKGHRASLCMFKEKCEKPGCWTGFLSSKTENRTTLAGWIWSLTLTPPLVYLIEPPCGGIAIRLKLGVHEVITYNLINNSLKITYSDKGPWDKCINFAFPTTYVLPKSLKISHWLYTTI